jgi:hypothetical protein
VRFVHIDCECCKHGSCDQKYKQESVPKEVARSARHSYLKHDRWIFDVISSFQLEMFVLDLVLFYTCDEFARIFVEIVLFEIAFYLNMLIQMPYVLVHRNLAVYHRHAIAILYQFDFSIRLLCFDHNAQVLYVQRKVVKF